MSEQLIEALKTLDPENDDHWTADGAPMLGAVTAALGSKADRKSIAAVAPGFSRGNPVIGEPAVEDGDDTENTDSAPDPGEDMGVDKMQARLESIEQEIAKLSSERDKLTKAVDKLTPRETPAEEARRKTLERQRFQKSQAEQRAKRNAQVANLNKTLASAGLEVTEKK